MSINNPRVTVGMPAYNRGAVIGESIRQVLAQTYSDFELIIYNDGSKDSTTQVVRSFADHRIIYIDRENMGPPYPLNAILNKARGEYIIILHDHDFFHPQLIEKSVNVLDKYKDAGFVLQGSAWIDEDGESNYREMLHDMPELNVGQGVGENMLLQPSSFNSIFHACCMVRHSAYEKIGKYYNVSFGLYADTDLWLRLLLEFDFVYLKEVLFKFRTREFTGHFLTNREFEVLEWNYQIHLKNAYRFFEGKLLNNAVELMHLKKNRLAVRLCIQYAANKNIAKLREGLEMLRKDTHTSRSKRFFFNVLLRFPGLQKIFARSIYFLNAVRKKYRADG